jgi:hypothetical protein
MNVTENDGWIDTERNWNQSEEILKTVGQRENDSSLENNLGVLELMMMTMSKRALVTNMVQAIMLRSVTLMTSLPAVLVTSV